MPGRHATTIGWIKTVRVARTVAMLILPAMQDLVTDQIDTDIHIDNCVMFYLEGKERKLCS